VPLNRTTAPPTNPAPLTAMFRSPELVTTLPGETLEIEGTGFGAITLSVATDDVPPPGPGVFTVIDKLPEALRSELMT
jgi:hypothetical protein